MIRGQAMHIIATLTKKHLKGNKSRTMVTVFGIMISVAMITAVFATTASFFDFFGRLGYISDGNGEATFRLLSAEQVQALRTDPRIEAVGVIDESEEKAGYTLSEGTTMRARRGTMYTGDIVNLEQMVTCRYEGKLPQNGSEIAIEESLLAANHLGIGIGDTITMELGRRTWINGEGKEEDYHGSYQSDEMFTPAGTRAFTVTAILYDNKTTGNFPILRGADEEELSKVPDGHLSAMIRLKKVDHTSYQEIMQMKDQYGIEKIRLNTEVLDAHFSLREGSSFVMLLPLLITVMIFIIIFSVILIYNAFSMSLAERIKYLGMLSSVGATRRQKRMSVYYEGFLLGILGIPLGIAAGLLGISVTLKTVGRRMLTAGIFPGIENTPEAADLSLVIPSWLLPAILLVSMLTIFIASMVPAQKASKIMPIDAIRQTNEIRVKNGKLKVPKVIGLIFGYEGELAWKNLLRNGRKSKVILFSIAASLIMFLCMNHFCNLFWESNSQTFNLPFSVFATASYDERDRLKAELLKLSDVEDVFAIDMFAYEYKKGSEKSPNMDIMDPDHFTKSYRRVFKDEMTVLLHLSDDEDFKALCARQGIDPAPYFGNETNALLCNNVSYTKKAKKAFSDSMLGQKLYYDDRRKNNPAVVTLKDFVEYEEDPHIFGMNSKNTVIAVIPYSTYVKTVYGENIPEDLCQSFGIATEKHKEVLEKVTYLLEDGSYHGTYCEDVVDQQGTLSAILFVMEVFTYGFLALITLITVTNILNTISTGIRQRRKEFAMLKSVGMTPAGFRKMINLESILIGILSVLWGIPLAILFCILMTELLPVSSRIRLNIPLYLISAAAVFLIIWLTMSVSVRELKNDTIVEVLKEEIS